MSHELGDAVKEDRVVAHLQHLPLAIRESGEGCWPRNDGIDHGNLPLVRIGTHVFAGGDKRAIAWGSSHFPLTQDDPRSLP